MIRKLRFAGSVRPRTAKLGKLKTSFHLEDEFSTALTEIAFEQRISISNLVADINKQRRHANLSSVIRLYVLKHYMRLAKERAKR
jgi:predicted DNA-binding ribbon-helix-helix protein